MLFNSLNFIIFFLITISLYFLIPYKFRWILLLISSYYFYMSWNIQYSLLLIIFTVINFIVAIAIEKQNCRKKKKNILIIWVIISLLILFLFKYYNFSIKSLELFFKNYWFNAEKYYLNILLPVWISFYTFQTIWYVLDVYWWKIKAEKNIFIFSLYVSFFPQLVAWPIERANNLLPQFRDKKEFKLENFRVWIHYILWGFFLKCVIADWLSDMVDFVYNQPEIFKSWLTFLIATYMFAYQIFWDFAWYTFIAIWVAKIMWYDLMKNFNRPYFAKSISDFWRRWHISLSTWFKDYLYIPLWWNRLGFVKNIRNVFIVFVVSWIWHWANFTFIIWWFLHWFFSSMEIMFKKIYKWTSNNKISNFIKIFITFHLVIITWIFFRANDLNDALYIFIKLFEFNTYTLEWIFFDRFKYLSILMVLWIIILEIIHIFNEKWIFFKDIFKKLNSYVQISIYIIFIYIILIFWTFIQKDFIYFQF